jgi:hypothetical protein
VYRSQRQQSMGLAVVPAAPRQAAERVGVITLTKSNLDGGMANLLLPN